MKKSKNTKSVSKKRKTKKSSSSVTIDKSLDSLSNRILFPKKLEDANRFLAKHGLPA